MQWVVVLYMLVHTCELAAYKGVSEDDQTVILVAVENLWKLVPDGKAMRQVIEHPEHQMIRRDDPGAHLHVFVSSDSHVFSWGSYSVDVISATNAAVPISLSW